jgi:hypothetical protein
MSRASKRQTTRVEDMAYSLVGIFDVVMPMLYGEGEKAFSHLQEKIIKKSNNTPIFVWKLDNHECLCGYVCSVSRILFYGCHDMLDDGLGGRTLSPSQFSISSRGIRFTAADLSVLKAQTSKEGLSPSTTNYPNV